MGHHLGGEELHGAHDLVVLHAGEGKVTPEIVDALLLQPLDFGNALVRCANECLMLIHMLQVYGGLCERLPLGVQALVVLAALCKGVVQRRHQDRSAKADFARPGGQVAGD